MDRQKRTGRPTGDEPAGLSGLIGGRLSLLGIDIDLAKLLESPGEVAEGLEALRERLKAAGGKERLSDEAWQAGGASVSGFIRTGGILGDQEFHVGTMGSPSRRGGETVAKPRGRRGAGADVAGPPLDLFDEGDEIRIVADVPGAELHDLELKAEDHLFSLATRPGARRSYRRDVALAAAVDPNLVAATCRNGVLEVRLRKL
jgi:HSP20 family protein